jgi:Phospholipase_D-nuclease N-terminal
VKALLFLLALGLLIYAAIDCSRTPDNEIPSGLPRSVWLVLLLILPILGPALWIVASRSDRDRTFPSAPSRRPGSGRPGGGRLGSGRPGGGPGRGGSSIPRAPRGPDDDPDFLHGL